MAQLVVQVQLYNEQPTKSFQNDSRKIKSTVNFALDELNVMSVTLKKLEKEIVTKIEKSNLKFSMLIFLY